MEYVLFRGVEKQQLKKIMFVVNVDWFFISHRLPLALEAIKRGYEVHIACGFTNKKEYLENLGLQVHDICLSRSSTSLFSELKVIYYIYNTLKLVKPDIVHFITIKPVLYGGIVSKLFNIQKQVFSIPGFGYVFTNQNIKTKLLKKFVSIIYKIALFDKNSTVIVQNNTDKNIVKIFFSGNIFLIRGSGVDLNIFQYRTETITNVKKVVMASRLLVDKGVFEYIETAKILNSKLKDVEFKLYGDIDPENPASLTKDDLIKIKQDGIIKLYGFTNNIYEVFKNSNLVVLPSYREGLPKVLVEASACGRAIVTTDVPGCKDAVIPNKTGLLCQVKDVKSLAENIEKLLLDNNLREKMGEEGRKLAEKEFDIKKIVKKHFEIYERKI